MSQINPDARSACYKAWAAKHRPPRTPRRVGVRQTAEQVNGMHRKRRWREPAVRLSRQRYLSENPGTTLADYVEHKAAQKRLRSKDRYYNVKARGMSGVELARESAGLPKPTREPPVKCECCGADFTSTPRLDHDHTTGKFRGWLCGKCNSGIGLLGDSKEAIQKALHYLNVIARGE